MPSPSLCLPTESLQPFLTGQTQARVSDSPASTLAICGGWPLLKHFHPSRVPDERPTKPFIEASLLAALRLLGYSQTEGGAAQVRLFMG